MSIKSKDNVLDSTKKKIKIKFDRPIGCLINSEGGEMIDECYHCQYLPQYPECRNCLTINKHIVVPLSSWGTPIKQKIMKDGEWQEYIQEFKVLPKETTSIIK